MRELSIIIIGTLNLKHASKTAYSAGKLLISGKSLIEVGSKMSVASGAMATGRAVEIPSITVDAAVAATKVNSLIESGLGIAAIKNSITGGNGSDVSCGESGDLTKKFSNDKITEIAQKLGFQRTNYYSKGQIVYKKGNKYITLDVDSNNGGFWKMADTIKGLSSKKTRLGTYDINLTRIGN